MRVAAHGNVDEFCAERDFIIEERYEGELIDYAGKSMVLVTDGCDELNEYYYLKYVLFKRGVSLVSTHWRNKDVSAFVEYCLKQDEERRRGKRAGRQPFGFQWDHGERVVNPATIGVARRIIALRDAGYTYRAIAEDPEVRYPDGRKMSISTVQVILNNRGIYEEEVKE